MRTLVALAAALLAGTASADTTLHYTVLFQGKPAGAETAIVHADGRVDVEMSYRNNGRGPDIHEHSRFGADGTLVSFDVKGKSTFGAPISESYTLKGGKAQWRSQADHGEAAVSGAAVYVPVDSSFEGNAAVVRAALRQPGNRIAALPGGEVTVKRVLDTQLESGGQSTTAVLYAVVGRDTQPDFIWLTAEADPRFFAIVVPGLARIIEQGWEAGGDTLERLQCTSTTAASRRSPPRARPRAMPPRRWRDAAGYSCPRSLTCTRTRTTGTCCCRSQEGSPPAATWATTTPASRR